MEIEDIIKYHINQLEYNQRKNKEYRNMPIWAKMDDSKTIYIPRVLKYRKAIKFHTEAIKALKELIKCLDH